MNEETLGMVIGFRYEQDSGLTKTVMFTYPERASNFDQELLKQEIDPCKTSS